MVFSYTFDTTDFFRSVTYVVGSVCSGKTYLVKRMQQQICRAQPINAVAYDRQDISYYDVPRVSNYSALLDYIENSTAHLLVVVDEPPDFNISALSEYIHRGRITLLITAFSWRDVPAYWRGIANCIFTTQRSITEYSSLASTAKHKREFIKNSNVVFADKWKKIILYRDHLSLHTIQ